MGPALRILYSDGERQGELIGLMTPLLVAAWTNLHLCEQLLDAGADVNLSIYHRLPQFFLDDHGSAARRQWKRDREDVRARDTGLEHRSTSLEAEDQQLRTPAERTSYKAAISACLDTEMLSSENAEIFSRAVYDRIILPLERELENGPVSWIGLQQPLPVVQRDHIRDDQLAAVRVEGELSKLHELRGQKDDTVMHSDGGTTPEVMALKCRFQSPELGQLPELSLSGQSSVKTAEHAHYTECLSTAASASYASSPVDDLDWGIRAARRHRPHGTSRRDGDDRRSHDRQSSDLLMKQNRAVNARSRSPSLDSLSSALSVRSTQLVKAMNKPTT
ncbi:hypothetical protein LTS15_001264 [Exophiala xenobiotica]|nr:hypothetical protein LTS15_001264 [Exophiala xenobiotica]